MPRQRDEQLEALGRERNAAYNLRDLYKRAVDSAKQALDGFQSEFNRLQREQSEANGSMHSCQSDAASYRKSRNHDMARYYAGKADDYRRTLNSIRSERERLIERQRVAKINFQNALTDLRNAQAECNRLKAAFDRRLEELKEQNARIRANQAEEQRRIRDIRSATDRPSGNFKGYHATVDGHNAVVETDESKTNIYYGGKGGDPLGKGHGHIVTSPDGQTTYVREPGTEGNRGPVRTDDKKS